MPKIVLPENIKKLKSQLENCNNLIDYFLVCGVSPSICKEKYLYDITNPKYFENLKQKLEPKIISKFPEFDISIDTIDEEIINYCFPKGFSPINTSNSIPPKTFSIILDNNLYSAEYPQKYLVCLLLYEKVSEYKRLELNIENRNPTPGDYLDDDRETFGGGLGRRESNMSVTSVESGNRQTMETKPSAMNALYNLNDKKDLLRSNNIKNKGGKLKYFAIPKCICIVSIHPFIKLFEKILQNIYHYSQGEMDIPIEKIITNLIIEVPIPPRGLYSIHYLLIDDLFTLINFENNRLQIAEINFKKFNRILSFETIIEGLKHILLCSKLLIFGSDLNIICETILAFLYLLFPFKYPFQVASFLHKDSYRILESVSPFIIGINEPYSDTFFENNDITIDGMNIFIIDLDKKSSESLLYESFPEFPKKLLEILEKQIKTLEVKFKRAKFQDTGGRNSVSSYNSCNNARISNTGDRGYSSLKDFNENYQYYFFYFFCEILKNYEKYLNMDYFNSNDSDKVTSIVTLFNCKKFIASHHSVDIPFYTKFIEDSQLFADFISKRMIPRNNQEIIDVLLVNETITKIKNRNKFIGAQKTDFLDSKQFKIMGIYDVPKPREITKEEKKYLLSKENDFKKKGLIIIKQKKLIKKEDKEIDLTNKFKSQIIAPPKNNFLNAMKSNIEKAKSSSQQNNEEENVKEVLNFNCYVFPELDFNLYCNNENVNDYYPPPDYSEEIEAVNTILISKSSLGQNINKNLEMRNYIYLTWLEIWSFTFWYIEKSERQYRFNQMLDILDKVIHHEMNLFNLMFDILNQQNEQVLIFKLYQKLLQLKINPSTFIYNIISNLLDKDQIKELIDETKNNTNKSLKFDINNNIISQLKERTFLSRKDKLLISSKLKFDSVFQCVKCGEKINLYNLCQNYDNVTNDTLWVPCPNKTCKEYNLPKINVKFGFELFPSLQRDKRKKNLSTCSTNEIVLHSPYNLKININNAVTTHYGNKLDLNSFKNNFNPLFWDFIWYCYIHNLDYSIILPYLYNIEHMNEISYNEPNKEIIQITFNNKVFKRNENIIYDVRSNKNTSNKKVSFGLTKVFKILIEEKEISIEIGKLAKDRNKKEICVFIDHLNKNNEIAGLKTLTSSTLNKEKQKGISSQLLRVPTRRRNIDFDIKFAEISLENVKMKDEMKNNLPVPINDKKSIDLDKKRVGIAIFKKNK